MARRLTTLTSMLLQECIAMSFGALRHERAELDTRIDEPARLALPNSLYHVRVVARVTKHRQLRLYA
jgi:hypothetical protein